MVLRAVDGMEPDVHPDAYVDPAAVVIGDVTVERDASIWPNVTLRGDHYPIVVGEEANVQDNAVCHEDAVLRRRATVGHSAIVHAATVEEEALVGMGAVVLDDATVGERAVVAAGSVVTEGTDVPPETLVAGTPAEVVKELDDPELGASAADEYVMRGAQYADTSRVVERD
ncbi:Carbonic anhydrase or acetyltransferase, isoleucine patch superfamily [Haloplanus vescus]|uniref:Carbonic anhydrase or acetyltransferase, isoleucine patch superfamily n=1 Tax=Haloplanus vescus TaxID=555874 RepID=A0A1H3YQJ4_9EURY|nr:gamma carbonic anhydrase family protein [Haloplanus vescus]SEA13760.1 Carbonic anhydrase or acetyltransferase, isoleucine patch superfamily [Haloplanus vescus]